MATRGNLKLLGLALLILAALSLWLGGCASPRYYAQAMSGQLELWQKAQPIDALLDAPGTPGPLKTKLVTVREVRNFATRELHLPDNGSYRKYADLQRQFVVWNVFAAEEFSVKAKEWCFAVAGCVGYRGYFSKEGADAFAATLRAEGYDVWVGGVPAYSTLGYFDDPVLSTFIRYSDPELARLVFHELAHQLIYVGGDSAFNESFAVTVEQEGVRRWTAARGTQADSSSFVAARERKADYLKLIDTYRRKLEALYASRLPVTEKRAAKAQLYREMRADYLQLKADWGGFAGYDWIFEQHLNNAFIASSSIYTQFVPAFQALLAKEGGDLDAFYRAVKTLANQTKASRDHQLAGLMTGTSVVSARQVR
jgi:predicted aminopeptidase